MLHEVISFENDLNRILNYVTVTIEKIIKFKYQNINFFPHLSFSELIFFSLFRYAKILTKRKKFD